MKNPLIIANWKMKLSPSDAIVLAKKISKSSSKYKGAEVAICPSFTDIGQVSQIIKETEVFLGAQDCFWEDQGAFTGEISPLFLQEFGVKYIIVGHSERRGVIGESNDVAHKKLRLILSLDTTPVLCVGETFEERQEGLKDITLNTQIFSALNGLWFNKSDSLVIAYEPVWVIGTGQDVDPEEISHTHKVIRQFLYDLLPNNVVDNQIKIIYGGSVDPENVARYLKQEGVQGVLIGTSSLDVVRFNSIIASAIKC
jgi:triosephosphate isomerase (TIM)